MAESSNQFRLRESKPLWVWGVACAVLMFSIFGLRQWLKPAKPQVAKQQTKPNGTSASKTTNAIRMDASDTTNTNRDPSKPVEQPPTPDTLLDKGELVEQVGAALESANHVQAYKLARQLIRLDPSDPTSNFLMARVLGLRKRYPEAIAMLDKLAKTTPDAKLAVLGQTSDWLVRYGKFDEAEERLNTLLKFAPDAVIVHQSLGRLLFRRGENQKAFEHFDRLNELGDISESDLRWLLRPQRPFKKDAQSIEPIGLLGEANKLAGIGDWQAVIELIKSKDVDLTHAENAMLGLAFARQKNNEQLSAWANINQKVANKNPDAWFAFATLASMNRQPRKAIACCCKCILLMPTYAEAYELLAESLADFDQFSKAQSRAFDRAKTLRRTQELGEAMANGKTLTDDDFGELVNLLQKLHRPSEAINWEYVRLTLASQNGTLSESEIKTAFRQIESQSQQVSPLSESAMRSFVLCGVDPNHESFNADR